MVRRGSADHIDLLRDEIEHNHPRIHIEDVSDYDLGTFNQCEQEGGIMISASIWEDIHPSLVMIPVNWDFSIPYGLITAKQPDDVVSLFLKTIQKYIDSTT